MAQGPGKYDALCTQVREAAGADMVVLLVVGGTLGEGFSVQMVDQRLCKNLPAVLRDMANQIEQDFA